MTRTRRLGALGDQFTDSHRSLRVVALFSPALLRLSITALLCLWESDSECVRLSGAQSVLSVHTVQNSSHRWCQCCFSTPIRSPCDDRRQDDSTVLKHRSSDGSNGSRKALDSSTHRSTIPWQSLSTAVTVWAFSRTIELSLSLSCFDLSLFWPQLWDQSCWPNASLCHVVSHLLIYRLSRTGTRLSALPIDQMMRSASPRIFKDKRYLKL